MARDPGGPVLFRRKENQRRAAWRIWNGMLVDAGDPGDRCAGVAVRGRTAAYLVIRTGQPSRRRDFARLHESRGLRSADHPASARSADKPASPRTADQPVSAAATNRAIHQ